jgi:putative flippase GtrA
MTLQLLRYVLAGGTALATHLAVMWIAVEVFAVAKVLASAIGFLSAISVNYLLQYRFVFGSEASKMASFILYTAVTLLTMALNVVVFSLLLALSPAHYLLIQSFTTAVVFLVNFSVNRSVTFNHTTLSTLASHLENPQRTVKEKWLLRRVK